MIDESLRRMRWPVAGEQADNYRPQLVADIIRLWPEINPKGADHQLRSRAEERLHWLAGRPGDMPPLRVHMTVGNRIEMVDLQDDLLEPLQHGFHAAVMADRVRIAVADGWERRWVDPPAIVRLDLFSGKVWLKGVDQPLPLATVEVVQPRRGRKKGDAKPRARAAEKIRAMGPRAQDMSGRKLAVEIGEKPTTTRRASKQLQLRQNDEQFWRRVR
jgi:hypothetical protein